MSLIFNVTSYTKLHVDCHYISVREGAQKHRHDSYIQTFSNYSAQFENIAVIGELSCNGNFIDEHSSAVYVHNTPTVSISSVHPGPSWGHHCHSTDCHVAGKWCTTIHRGGGVGTCLFNQHRYFHKWRGSGIRCEIASVAFHVTSLHKSETS